MAYRYRSILRLRILIHVYQKERIALLFQIKQAPLQAVFCGPFVSMKTGFAAEKGENNYEMHTCSRGSGVYFVS